MWETRAGSIDLKIPKLRRGSYFPGLADAWLPKFRPVVLIPRSRQARRRIVENAFSTFASSVR
jgi:hypothetical protein